MKKLCLSDQKIDKNPRNPVAKFAHAFNKAQVFVDKTKYKRNLKHKKQEVSFNILLMNNVLKETACFIRACF